MKKIVSFLLIFVIVFFFLPQLAYANSPGPNFDGTYDRSPTWILNVVIIYCVMIAFTCLVEWLVSIPFQMHKECWKIILITNIITQVVMHLVEFITLVLMVGTGGALYWIAVPFVVAGLEIVIYVTEFFVYQNKMLGFPTWQIIVYTILANTASLVLGLLIIF